MDVMEHLAADLSCALDEIRKPRHWKNRRTRSTSNFIGSGPGLKTDSDESKDGNESDDAERCFAKLSIQNKSGAKLPLQSVVESDSFNELFGGCSSSQPKKASQTKRRKRHKRMAVEPSDGLSPGISVTAAVVPKVNDSNHVGKKTKKKVSTSTDPQRAIEVDIGKRKRGHRLPNDSTNSTGAIVNTDVLLETMTSIELNNEEMDEDMKSDGDSSSVFSATESESTEETSSEGQEGDDEHSDYIVDEWVDDTAEMSVERRRDLIMRRLRDYAPYREIRAGRRRIHPNKPVFSFRTSANEQLSKFLQDPEQSELRLHPMRKAERIQLSQIASLYSLQMHYHREDDGSEKGFTCPILTKTSNTAQMDTKSNDEGEKSSSWLGPSLNIENESDSKRIKK